MVKSLWGYAEEQWYVFEGAKERMNDYIIKPRERRTDKSHEVKEWTSTAGGW
jgi:hypothetical protein